MAFQYMIGHNCEGGAGYHDHYHHRAAQAQLVQKPSCRKSFPHFWHGIQDQVWGGIGNLSRIISYEDPKWRKFFFRKN